MSANEGSAAAAARKKLAPRLVTISSGVNASLVIGAPSNPYKSGDPLALTLFDPAFGLQPLTWWLLNPVTDDRSLFQILFFPSDGKLCLSVKLPAKPGDALLLSEVAPSDRGQLWQIDEKQTKPQLVMNRGDENLCLGFPYEIPISGIQMTIDQSPERLDIGDQFVFNDVKL